MTDDPFGHQGALAPALSLLRYTIGPLRLSTWLLWGAFVIAFTVIVAPLGPYLGAILNNSVLHYNPPTEGTFYLTSLLWAPPISTLVALLALRILSPYRAQFGRSGLRRMMGIFIISGTYLGIMGMYVPILVYAVMLHLASALTGQFRLTPYILAFPLSGLALILWPTTTLALFFSPMWLTHHSQPAVDPASPAA